jgi:predicted rRNA methylase YqxC with S4 and FtsJ domains
MAQWLSSTGCSTEVLSSTPSTHVVAHNQPPRTQVQWDLRSSRGVQLYMQTTIHVRKYMHKQVFRKETSP